ncbi:MAG: hypothetical protein H7Y39_16195 [Nitrospiraceae bacterium]|nr:hypothetical protein [Nitrospiraceae bacterium]
MNIMQPQYSLKNHLVGQRVESAPLSATILLVDDDDSLRDVAGTTG